MYSVYADGVCIYNDAFALDNMKLASPKLTLEDNAAGSFVMTVPPSNLGYSTIIRILALLGREQIAEALSQVALKEIIGVVLIYGLKALFENLSKNNSWPDKENSTPPEDGAG